MNIREKYDDGTTKRASAKCGNVYVSFYVYPSDDTDKLIVISDAWGNRLTSGLTHADDVDGAIRCQIAAWNAFHVADLAECE
jgi:hypothetical protein